MNRKATRSFQAEQDKPCIIREPTMTTLEAAKREAALLVVDAVCDEVEAAARVDGPTLPRGYSVTRVRDELRLVSPRIRGKNWEGRVYLTEHMSADDAVLILADVAEGWLDEVEAALLVGSH